MISHSPSLTIVVVLPGDGRLPVRIDPTEFSAELLATQETIPRARIVARTLGLALQVSSVNIYLLVSGQEGEAWAVQASHGEQTIRNATIVQDSGTLHEVAESGGLLLFSAADLAREDYAHLDIRRTLRSLAYLPLTAGDALIGAAELLTFEADISAEDIEELQAIGTIGGSSLAAATKYEAERNDSLASISRLTQLYDLEKTFSSTLEMEELLPVIGEKFREVLECDAVNLWLLRGDESLQLMYQAGSDPTTPAESIQSPGEGIPGDVSNNGETVLINDPDDPKLGARSASVASGGVSSLIVAPIMDKESLVGVMEAVNKKNGVAFDEDDLFALVSITETASIALHNASLLMAERKAEILETLVTVSNEITSTLNLDRMLQTIVNAPQAVIPYERAAIALEQRGRFKLAAVTGVMQLNSDAPEIAPLNAILQWVALAQEVVHIQQHGEDLDSDREETRAKFKEYFSKSGARGFYAMPLGDDTGRVGILSLESSDPEFLTPVHLELLQVLAGQATVALRNAQMYKEVPFISVLEPVLQRKRRFMALEKTRRTAILIGVALAFLFLVLFPVPLRLDGDATVAPVHRALIQPEFEGVIGKVFVHEGEPVKQGQILAEMESWDRRAAVAQAEAKYQASLLQMGHSLANNDGAEAGIQRVQADYWKAEVSHAQELLSRAQLRSPIDGMISTPHVDTFAGRRLQLGDTFAEVIDASSAIVDVELDASDVGLLRMGQNAVVKLNSYPTRTFHGTVSIVSPRGETQGDARVFYARVAVPNADSELRTGMQGRAKITSGWRTSGYVLLRKPAIWLYTRVWNWFGW